MRTANWVIKFLENIGVEYIFGIPGHGIYTLYDAMADSNVKPILVKHEEGASLMAMGYSLGKIIQGNTSNSKGFSELGVCLGSCAGGATNLITGVASAWTESFPLLVITGEIDLQSRGKGALEETLGDNRSIDILKVFDSMTKYNVLVPSSKKLPEMLKRAIRIAVEGRQGPVHLNIPKDVFLDNIDENKFSFDTFKIENFSYDDKVIDKIVDLLISAKKPAILAGTGTILSNATAELQKLVEILTIPTATTIKGKGSFITEHPLSMGCAGLFGSPLANYYLSSDIDVLFCIGASLNEFTTQGWDPNFAKSAKIIQLDIDPLEIGKVYNVALPVVGDAKLILKKVIEKLEQLDVSKIKDEISKKTRLESLNEFYKVKNDLGLYLDANSMNSDDIPLKPHRVMKEIREALPSDALIFSDSGSNTAFAFHYLPCLQPNTFYAAFGYGAMGPGVVMAIGAKLAFPQKVVLSICGDGAFLMNGNELSTAVSHNIPVIWLIFNDGRINFSYFHQKIVYNKPTATCFKKVDFTKVAEGMGANGIKVEKPGEVKKAIISAIESNCPTLIDVTIDPDIAPPFYPFLKKKDWLGPYSEDFNK